MAGELEGKVSIITGGGSGMGRSTALMFAREGAAVAIADVNDEGGEATAAQIEDLGGNATFIHTDTSSESDVLNLVSGTVDKFGRLDSMVTAAGISYADYVEGDEASDPFLHPDVATILNKPTERWQKVIDVNLTGVMLCAREAARRWWPRATVARCQLRIDRCLRRLAWHHGLLRLQGWRDHADALLRC